MNQWLRTSVAALDTKKTKALPGVLIKHKLCCVTKVSRAGDANSPEIHRVNCEALQVL